MFMQFDILGSAFYSEKNYGSADLPNPYLGLSLVFTSEIKLSYSSFKQLDLDNFSTELNPNHKSLTLTIVFKCQN